MPGFSSVVVLGNLTCDPELLYTSQGAALCQFALAVNRKYTRKDGLKVEEVSFIDVTAWNRVAEASAEYLQKGRLALVSGRLVQDRWEDGETGQRRSKLKVVAESVQFVGGGSKDDANSQDAPAPEPAPAPEEEPAAEPPVLPPGVQRASEKFRRPA